MDISTGKLGRYNELVEAGSSPEELIAIKEEAMTAKQRATMQVSKHDNRSQLGKLRVAEFKTRNQLKRLRKQARVKYH